MHKYLIVGAGIFGAAIAERLAAAGEEVVIVEGVAAASGATGASFGWINASFYLDEAHFRLREDALRAWRDCAGRLNLPLTWTGCLSWAGDIEASAQALGALGYPVELMPRARAEVLEPALRNVPDTVLHFGAETAAEPATITRALMRAALDAGAVQITGQRVLSVLAGDGRAVGVETDAGLIMADQIILAAGTGTSELLEPLGCSLPLLTRPADLLITQPAQSMLSHVLVTDEREIRQNAEGCFNVPSSPKHQEVTGLPDAFHLETTACASMAVLRRHLPVGAMGYRDVRSGRRPVPSDGRPVIGPTSVEGLYAAVMHSGITLAALIGELAVGDLQSSLCSRQAALLAPYRLDRFQTP